MRPAGASARNPPRVSLGSPSMDSHGATGIADSRSLRSSAVNAALTREWFCMDCERTVKACEQRETKLFYTCIWAGHRKHAVSLLCMEDGMTCWSCSSVYSRLPLMLWSPASPLRSTLLVTLASRSPDRQTETRRTTVRAGTETVHGRVRDVFNKKYRLSSPNVARHPTACAACSRTSPRSL